MDARWAVPRPGCLTDRAASDSTAANRCRTAACATRSSHRCRAAVLPDDRVMHRLTGLAIPQHRRLALIGDADRAHVVRSHPRVGERRTNEHAHAAPDLVRVVLHPTGAWVMLRDFGIAAAA